MNNDSFHENYSRHIISKLFQQFFIKINPYWMYNPIQNSYLELDLYNKDLNIAIEYNGPCHYFMNEKTKNENSYITLRAKDYIKQMLCIKNNICFITIPYFVDLLFIKLYISFIIFKEYPQFMNKLFGIDLHFMNEIYLGINFIGRYFHYLLKKQKKYQIENRKYFIKYLLLNNYSENLFRKNIYFRNKYCKKINNKQINIQHINCDCPACYSQLTSILFKNFIPFINNKINFDKNNLIHKLESFFKYKMNIQNKYLKNNIEEEILLCYYYN